MRTVRTGFVDGLLAGMLISIGGAVFMACDNRYCGAVFFSVALLSICLFGFNLYTGKIGLVVKNHSKSDNITLISGLVGNLIAATLMGMIVTAALPNLSDNANVACLAKLEQTGLQTFLRGCLCGLLIYVAVWVYREKNSIVGIVLGIPVFILSGYEHSIADMFYFSLAGILKWETCRFIFFVLLGNSVGALVIPLLQLLRGGDAK